MNNKYTAVIKQDDDWWLGWIEEIPGVNCQEASHDELIESLKMTLQEAFAKCRDAFSPQLELPLPPSICEALHIKPGNRCNCFSSVIGLS